MEQGGIKCYNFLTFGERMIDTSAFIVFAIVVAIPTVVRKLSFAADDQRQQQIITDNNNNNNNNTKNENLKNDANKNINNSLTDPSMSVVGLRKLLLLSLCVVLGVEIGFKLTKQTWIYTLNVCHVITMCQIYLLSSQPSTTTTAVFRVHVHLLFPALFAIMFPSTSQVTSHLSHPDILIRKPIQNLKPLRIHPKF